MTNRPLGTLYIGVTNNLIRRVYEHKNGMIKGFTKKYNLNKLVFFEGTDNIYSAIQRGKNFKALGAILEGQADRRDES